MASNPRTFQPSSVATAYADALAYLGGKAIRKIAHNTNLVACDDTTAVVTYHGNPIIRYHANGEVTVHACGWRTFTTKERLCWFLPAGFSVAQEAHEWFLYGPNHYRARFVDGMALPRALRRAS